MSAAGTCPTRLTIDLLNNNQQQPPSHNATTLPENPLLTPLNLSKKLSRKDTKSGGRQRSGDTQSRGDTHTWSSPLIYDLANANQQRSTHFTGPSFPHDTNMHENPLLTPTSLYAELSRTDTKNRGRRRTGDTRSLGDARACHTTVNYVLPKDNQQRSAPPTCPPFHLDTTLPDNPLLTHARLNAELNRKNTANGGQPDNPQMKSQQDIMVHKRFKLYGFERANN